LLILIRSTPALSSQTTAVRLDGEVEPFHVHRRVGKTIGTLSKVLIQVLNGASLPHDFTMKPPSDPSPASNLFGVT